MSWFAAPALDDADQLARGTLVHALEARAAADSDSPFVAVGHRPGLSAAALLALVRGCSAGLGRFGVEQGDAVLVVLDSSPEFLVTWLGLGHRGAVMVPLVPRSGLRAYRRAIELCEPSLAIVSAQGAERLGEAVPELPFRVIQIDDRAPGEICPELERRLLVPDDDAPNRARGPELASIMFTSGTTGPPKGVRVAHLWYVWASLDVAGAMRYTGDDVLYTCLPLGHANAQDTSFGPALLTGARIVFDPDFSASRFWARLAETGATAFNLIGNMPEVLLSRAPDEHVEHRARRAFSVPALAHQLGPFRERFGVQLVEGYGSTEIGVPVFQDVDAIRAGTSGRPLPGTLMRIEREDGLPAAVGERGEICAWSPRPGSCTAGYYRDDAATAHAWRGGWFHTGDLGLIDEDGCLHFSGRVTDSLRRKGENISAFEVEAALLELGEVAACGVVGRPRADGDEDVIAFVVAAEGSAPSAEMLVAHCAAALGPVAAPAEIRFVDGLPETESGKVAKGALRDLASRGRQEGST
jgi:carnitine-CoA ligase